MAAKARPRVGIIGKGNVGSALEKGLTRAGYQVETTGKDSKQVKPIAENADIVVLAVPYGERENAVKEAGGLGGKVVVDVTNALDKDDNFVASAEKAGAEERQELASSAKVVKAFNTVFAGHMEKGEVKGEKLTLFAAADDDEAKKRVLQLGKDISFDVVDAGPLRNARWLETMGYLNIQLGYNQRLGTDAGVRYLHPGSPTR